MTGRALAGGKLVVEERIGSGGAGTVYKARHRELHTTVAVKLLNPSLRLDDAFRQRFHAEALAASRLDHRNLMRVQDFGEEPDGLLYLAMDLVEGKDLRTVLEEEGALDARRAIHIVVQVCAGLGHAHGRGIIHRDVKPENVIVLRRTDDDDREVEHVKVCDFGIAQAAASDPSGGVDGTPHYMSPEQCRGERLDARSDVYACGVLLYELLTGGVPFEGDTMAVMAKQLMAPPPPLSRRKVGVDPRLERLVLRTLSKNPEDRPQSMRELRAELLQVLDPSAAVEPPSERERTAAAVAPSPASSPGATSADPDVSGWLEDRKAVYATFLAGRSVALEEPPAPRPARAMAAWNCASAIADLVATRDPRSFAKTVERVAAVLPDLVARRDVDALWRLACTLDGIASEGPDVPGSRRAAAAALAQRFADPAALSELAGDLLAGTSSAPASAGKLLVRAGAVGARAAYSARTRDHSAGARARFTALIADMGQDAEPAVCAALERLEQRLAASGAAEIACDLLAVVQPRPGGPLAELIVRYARVSDPVVAHAAMAARSRAVGTGRR